MVNYIRNRDWKLNIYLRKFFFKNINIFRFTTLHFEEDIEVWLKLAFDYSNKCFFLIRTVNLSFYYYQVNCDLHLYQISLLLVGLSVAAATIAVSLISAAARRDASHAPDSKFCTHTQYRCFIALPLRRTLKRIYSRTISAEDASSCPFFLASFVNTHVHIVVFFSDFARLLPILLNMEIRFDRSLNCIHACVCAPKRALLSAACHRRRCTDGHYKN